MNVNRQTVPFMQCQSMESKYGAKPVKIACSSLEVKTFLLFLVRTLHCKSGKNCVFSEVNTFFGWSLCQSQKKAHPP